MAVHQEEIRYVFTPDTGRLESALAGMDGRLGRYNTQLRTGRRGVGDLGAETDRATQATDRFRRSSERAGRASERAGRRGRVEMARFNRQMRVGLLNELDRVLPNSLSRATDSMGLFTSKGTLALKGSAIAAGALTAAVGVGLVGAIVAAGAAMMEFRRQFIQGMNEEVERVGRVQMAMQALNLSRQEAGRYNQELELAIANTGRNMPVSVADIQAYYGAAGDEIAEFFRGQGMGLGGIRDQTVSTSSRLAIIQQLSGIGSQNALANVQAYLGGAGAGELRTMTLFQRNPRLLRELQDGVRRGENRVELLVNALNDYVTDDMINALQGTAKARWSAFVDTWFDPTIGILSITRDLDPQTEGYQSVMTEFGETIRLVFGSEGLIDQVVAAFNLIDQDPMEALRDQVIQFNQFLEDLNNFFGRLDTARENNKFLDQSMNWLGDTFTHAPREYAIRPNSLLGRLFNVQAKPQFTGSYPGLDGGRMGNMPLLDAIATEIMNKPTGAGLVIANTSEYVLTQNQMAQLMAGRGGGGIGTVNITINQQPGQDAHQLAQVVIAALDDAYSSEKDSFL